MSYRKGFEDGLRCFAWWKDGAQQVGTCGWTLKDALEHIEDLGTFSPPPAPESYPLDDLTQLVDDALCDETECSEWTRGKVGDHFLKNLKEVLEGRGLVMGEKGE